MKWIQELDVPGGHRYFRDEATFAIAIADRSGRYPDQTDDGVLWLDTRKDIVIDKMRHIFIPLRTPNGSEVTTPASVLEALEVARHFGMNIVLRAGDLEARVEPGEIDKLGP